MVRALLKQGVDLSLPSGAVSRSALSHAAFFKRAKVIEVSLEGGADVNTKDKLGMMLVKLAEIDGLRTIAQVHWE